MAKRFVITAIAALLVCNVSADAQLMPGHETMLDKEVAGFPDYLSQPIRAYADALIAKQDKFTDLQVSNCHWGADMAALVLQEQGRTSDDVFFEYVIRSRALAYLSLTKLPDTSAALPGSIPAAIEANEMSTEQIVKRLPEVNGECRALFARIVGPLFGEDDHTAEGSE